ncbi:MAG: hypothetical protein L0241_02030, partial [Planctomycetia bacterium]|nr:hypothetical protein [Planctomycetia bacterium]
MFRIKTVFVAMMLLRLRLVIAPLMLFTARSWRGRVEGTFAVVVGAIIFGGLIYLGSLAFETATPVVARTVALVGLVLFLPMCFLAAGLARKCHFGEGAVGSHFLKAEPSQDSLGWADVEDDYLWLIVQLITRLDWRIPSAEARDTRDCIRELVDAIRVHPDYHCFGRITDSMSWGLFRGELDPHHCYSYLPQEREPNEKFGLLVFLHGHGTNYLILLHALRSLCDRQRLILIAPSFGYGNWESTDSVEAVERATRFGLAAFDADPARVFLAGISQGGAGVSRAAEAYPDRFAGLIFISSTMETSVIGSQAFAEGWKGRPVLVIQGDRDRFVRPETVNAAVHRLEADEVKVTYHRDPEGGHFLFFA